MSVLFLRALPKNQCQVLKNKQTISEHVTKANYSRRNDAKKLENAFKVVKSKVRQEANKDFLGIECGPNWELLAPKANRFYFPHSVGPAWQGVSTTVTLDVPLEAIVNFGKESNSQKLQFSVNKCPNLLKQSLHQLFPAPEVVSADRLSLITLKFKGDNEQGASKFVLAAREITSRLRLHGYWADFMNPFSGKPFYSWASGKHLYKIDDRFRGINMKLTNHHECCVITKDNDESIFSGAIYSNAPAQYDELKNLLDERIKF